jgi:hypothetical protein
VGQGVGSIDEILPVSEVVARLKHEYRTARRVLGTMTDYEDD